MSDLPSLKSKVGLITTNDLRPTVDLLGDMDDYNQKATSKSLECVVGQLIGRIERGPIILPVEGMEKTPEKIQ